MKSNQNRRVLVTVAIVVASALPAPATTHTVNQVGFDFVPDSLTIQQGDTVQWIRSGGTHTVTEGTPCTPNGGFNEPLTAANPLVSITFNSPGTVDYFCTPHCSGFNMFGVIIVEPCPAADGNINGDGSTDGLDIEAFVRAVIGGSPAPAEICSGDFNANQALDPGDIPGLVNALLN